MGEKEDGVVIKEVKDWQDFEEKLRDLDSEVKLLNEKNDGGVSELLFRGQPNSELKTSLDRFVGTEISLYYYYEKIINAKPEIESFTGSTLEIPSLQDYGSKLEKYPAPLLDWTASPYVSAYFACDSYANANNPVAIYAYLEFAGQAKNVPEGEPWIIALGPYVRTHRRHFIQQSRYTVCVQIRDKTAYYASHEEGFISSNKSRTRQDIGWKFLIPSEQRIDFLKRLDRMNINGHSLFGSEESLLRTIATREFKLKKASSN